MLFGIERFAYVLLLITGFVSGTLYNSQYDAWPFLSANRAIALRTQRDISKSSLITYDVVTGVNLTTVIFQSLGYNDSSFTDITDLLNVGIQALSLDLYYNEYTKNWSLCPYKAVNSNSLATQCGNASTFNLASIASIVDSFLLDTDSILNTNMFYVLLNLNSMVDHESSNLSGVHRLGKIFKNITNLITPEMIHTSKLPTIGNLLFTENIRLSVVIVENNMPANTSYDLSSDLDTVFIASDLMEASEYQDVQGNTLNPLPMLYEPFDLQNTYNSSDSNQTKFRFLYETPDSQFTLSEFHTIISSGYSQIISRSFSNLSDISDFLDNSLWSWRSGQPPFVGSIEGNNGEIIEVGKNAGRCAVVTKLGWKATSCALKYRSMCQNSNHDAEYVITDDTSNYRSAAEKCYELNETYVVAVPYTAGEQSKMTDMISGDDDGVWININSISSANCWVQGVNTVCPYQKTISKRIFIKMITPGSVVSFVLVLLLIAFQFNRVPVHKNRRHWRRLMNDRLAGEFEGVAS
ncbi:hypothetical protein FOA43_000176 [Brettanomyces nanus]|uniref:Maintenance of telomere capping protein 6 n=1 Tax=Eeniella nana TaxID=13502 RepID=A0A875RWN0_EENNA|nr:uncharacterized protein FOA43_000176 [Brettanomyces nanus]QPG72873.1 hypothetical protein FOA43_000176 [Brettanomyces nanus]